MKRVAILLLMLTLTAWATLSAQAPKAAPAGSVENGKKTYVSRACWMCHGFAAQGGDGPGGPRLAGRVPEWERFSKYVRRPTDQMIPYPPKVMTDQELADVFLWLKALPAPLPLSSLPQLKQ